MQVWEYGVWKEHSKIELKLGYSKKKKVVSHSCNCRNKNTCPLEGNCNTRNIVYQAEVTTPQTKETYIGLCDTTFKERYRTCMHHTCSFRNERYKTVTELSKHIWILKERNINYQIKWRKEKQARSYSNGNKDCNLCLWEKYFIICKPEMSTLHLVLLILQVISIQFIFVPQQLFKLVKLIRPTICVSELLSNFLLK